MQTLYVRYKVVPTNAVETDNAASIYDGGGVIYQRVHNTTHDASHHAFTQQSQDQAQQDPLWQIMQRALPNIVSSVLQGNAHR